jgi:hypothetical protein
MQRVITLLMLTAFFGKLRRLLIQMAFLYRGITLAPTEISMELELGKR